MLGRFIVPAVLLSGNFIGPVSSCLLEQIKWLLPNWAKKVQPFKEIILIILVGILTQIRMETCMVTFPIKRPMRHHLSFFYVKILVFSKFAIRKTCKPCMAP